MIQQQGQLIIESAPEIFESVQEDKKLYMTGCIGQADIINGNGRRYALPIMQEAVEEYNEKFVKTRTALGELNHPARPYADPALATHRIVEMWMDGPKVMAKASVLENAHQLRALINDGWLIQASTRGLGQLESKTITEAKGNKKTFNEVTAFKMTVGFDVVQGQSAPDAILQGVYECIDGLYIPKNELQTSTIDWDLIMNRLKKQYIK